MSLRLKISLWTSCSWRSWYLSVSYWNIIAVCQKARLLFLMSFLSYRPTVKNFSVNKYRVRAKLMEMMTWWRCADVDWSDHGRRRTQEDCVIGRHLRLHETTTSHSCRVGKVHTELLRPAARRPGSFCVCSSFQFIPVRVWRGQHAK